MTPPYYGRSRKPFNKCDVRPAAEFTAIDHVLWHDKPNTMRKTGCTLPTT